MEDSHDHDHDHSQTSIKILKGISKGVISRELDIVTLDGIQVVEGRAGFLRCKFVVPERLADKDGNWEVGAIATLVDDVGELAMYSFFGHFSVSVDFSISFYSTARIQEEVEIEAQVLGKREKLEAVLVHVRRKINGELIALGKQWMASTNINATTQVSKL